MAIILATERDISVVAPVHDAIMIEFELENEEETVWAAQEAMRKASSVVLDGFELRTEAGIVSFPDRYRDERGEKMWKTVWEIIREIKG